MLLSFGFSKLRDCKEKILMPKEWQENAQQCIS